MNCFSCTSWILEKKWRIYDLAKQFSEIYCFMSLLTWQWTSAPHSCTQAQMFEFLTASHVEMRPTEFKKVHDLSRNW